MLSDPAQSPLASCRPHIAEEIDTLRDFFLESVSRFKGDLPTTILAFQNFIMQIVDEVLQDASDEAIEKSAADLEHQEDVTISLLETMGMADDPHIRMKALCYLRLLGREERSFEELGQVLGVRRATVNKCYRDLQCRIGLRGLGDKSEEARNKYREIRLGKRKIRPAWAGLNAWKNPLPLSALITPA